MMPLWSSYLVRVYAWKLLLAKEGVVDLDRRAPRPRAGCSRRVLALPVVGGPSLSVSYIGSSWCSSISGCPS